MSISMETAGTLQAALMLVLKLVLLLVLLLKLHTHTQSTEHQGSGQTTKLDCYYVTVKIKVLS